MIHSQATPTTTVDEIHELTRVWGAQQPRASIVLVHGVSEHSGRYERVGGWLAAAGFDVEAFDLIGCGATGGSRGDISDWTKFQDQIEGHLAPKVAQPMPSILIGHSMGGLLVAEYLSSVRPMPDLAVLSAPGLAGGAKWQRTVATATSRFLGRVSVPSAVKGADLSRDPAVGAAYFADPLVHTKGTVRFGRSLFDAMDRTTSQIGQISVPTLVLHGTADLIVPPESSEVFEGVPGVERRTFPDLRHELFNEPEGEQIVGDVIQWIDERLAEI